jgi:hypothetical protein
MPVIEKISSLRNYQNVLAKVQPGNPVFLTKNGQGQYAILDNDEYDLLYKAADGEFYRQLDEARTEAEKRGWTSLKDVGRRFGAEQDV